MEGWKDGGIRRDSEGCERDARGMREGGRWFERGRKPNSADLKCPQFTHPFGSCTADATTHSSGRAVCLRIGIPTTPEYSELELKT
eukprot:2237900-Rhodomonas_salina.1